MPEQTTRFHGSYAKFPATSGIVALILAVIPFFAHFTTTSTRTVNGRVVESSYTDFVAIACSILAVLLGLYSIAKLKDMAASDRIKRMGAIVVIVLLGGYQTLSGFGVFYNPSASTSSGAFPPPLRAEAIASRMAPPTRAQANPSKLATATPPQAIVDLFKAIELDPTQVGTYLDRGAVYSAAGEPEQAVSDHDKAIEMQPAFAGAYLNRALVFIKAGVGIKIKPFWIRTIS